MVITGVGTVGAHGCGREALAALLAGDNPKLSEVPRPTGYHRRFGARPRLAALVDPSTLKPHLDAAAARRMSPPSKFAVAAAKMAVAQAGLAPADVPPESAVVVATSFGPTSYTERILNQILLESPEAVSPMLFTESVANAPAAQIALTFGAVGANVTVTQREVGPLVALGRAVAEVATGRSPLAIAAAVDETSPVLHAVLDRLGALAPPDAEGREVARPFDRGRNGFLLAEGAGALVVEAEEAARRRGAAVLARVRRVVIAVDPRAPRIGWSEDASIQGSALLRRLAMAGLAPGDFDLVVSGASGSIGGDRLEAAILRQLWPSREMPPVLAPKGVIGEYGGGLLAPAVLAAEGVAFGPTAGFREVDPALGIVPHSGQPLAPPHRLLVSSLAAGGAAAWVVLERPEA